MVVVAGIKRPKCAFPETRAERTLLHYRLSCRAVNSFSASLRGRVLDLLRLSTSCQICLGGVSYKTLHNGFVLAATIVNSHTRDLAMTDHEKWIEKYVQAALEVRGELMLDRINAARKAIAERLKQLEGDSNHHSERHQIGSALVSLMVLEEESHRWERLSSPAPRITGGRRSRKAKHPAA
jgi:hypothetical protein